MQDFSIVSFQVEKWKKTASKQLAEVNKMYNHGRSKNKEIFSVPMGLEANRKIIGDVPDDSSSKSQSTILGQYNAEEEIDIRRNDEFIREVRRVLRCRKSPQILEKRSLPEEYSRLIFKKTALLRSRDRQIALTEKGDPVTENTDTGADGDNNSEPSTGIFEQLSEMVLKNKITKNSKAAQQRNEVLREVERKRCDDIDNSEIDEKVDDNCKNEITKNKFVSQPDPSSEVRGDQLKNQNTIENYGQLQIVKPDEFRHLPNLEDDKNCRLKKVESYLSSVPDVQPVNPALPEISQLTTEREQSLFDSLSGEFLKNMATGNERKYKITRNDKKLLAIIVKRYIDRGALGQIDELMNSNLNEKILNVPPYENVTDREEFFLKKIIRKFISRGMRDTLEDLIAWIYYKLDDARNTQQPEKQERIRDEDSVKRMVNAFNNSGKNPSLNRIVTQLLRDHMEIYPGLNARQISAVEEMIKNMVIERFARVYLEQTKMDVDQNSQPHISAVNVKNECEMNSGNEHFDVNGRYIEIKWKHAPLQGR